MLAKERLATNDKRIVDVNALAIFLVEDHPGHPYLAKVVEHGLRGAYIPLIMDVLPIRAYWIMTRRWDCDPGESRDAIIHFIRAYDSPVYFQLRKETIVRSFEVAEETSHDVFDCTYIGAAIQEKATGLITTDTDFERLCKRYNVGYWNPVPTDILKRFKDWRSARIAPSRE